MRIAHLCMPPGVNEQLLVPIERLHHAGRLISYMLHKGAIFTSYEPQTVYDITPARWADVTYVDNYHLHTLQPAEAEVHILPSAPSRPSAAVYHSKAGDTQHYQDLKTTRIPANSEHITIALCTEQASHVDLGGMVIRAEDAFVQQFIDRWCSPDELSRRIV